jgi:enoyl-CoA hydratase/carnithine racemase
MSGWRMNAADAIHAGFADVAVASDDLDSAENAIGETADPKAIRFRAPGGRGDADAASGLRSTGISLGEQRWTAFAPSKRTAPISRGRRPG